MDAQQLPAKQKTWGQSQRPPEVDLAVQSTHQEDNLGRGTNVPGDNLPVEYAAYILRKNNTQSQGARDNVCCSL